MERNRNVAFGKSDVKTCRNSIQKVRRRTYLAKGLKDLQRYRVLTLGSGEEETTVLKQLFDV